MAKIAILGTGAWGTALANVLLSNKHQVAMWGVDQTQINDLKKQVNTQYYGNTKLVSSLKLVTNIYLGLVPNSSTLALTSVKDCIKSLSVCL